MLSFIYKYNSETWFFISIVTLFLEIYFDITVIMLSISMSALILGVVSSLAILTGNNLLIQITIFIVLSCVFMLILLKPIKKIKRKYHNKYLHLIGRNALVVTNISDINPGTIKINKQCFDAVLSKSVKPLTTYKKGKMVKIIIFKRGVFHVE